MKLSRCLTLSLSLILALAACSDPSQTGSPNGPGSTPNGPGSTQNPDGGVPSQNPDLSQPGQNPDQGQNPVGPQSLNPDDPNRIWDIQTQTCNGGAVQSTDVYYKFQKGYLVRVEKKSEDANSVCRIGYIYSRIGGSMNTTSAEYDETATLQSAGTKTTCWQKQNGQQVEPPISNQTGTFGPEQINMKLVATPTGLSLDLDGSPACAAGTLHIQLKQR